ncbi:PIG-L deacetylase family protein [Mesorhizobium sp. AaZ16]|uniref:PIG-L deacetylase family protein n=1 Tax=Mesorhizobium sp. AaZ16 TaxID=3402289 RepID=UPI00374EA149
MEYASAVVHGALADFANLISPASGNGRSGDELMVVAAHPDDEAIGLGGQLSRLRNAAIVHVTDGAPRDLRDARTSGFGGWREYADARRRELEAAMAGAGIDPRSLVAIGLPDQEATYAMAPLACSLARLFAERQPRFVCTHPFEGGHPDHDATAFAVDAACRLVRREGLIAPAVIEFACYNAGPDGGPIFQNFAAEPPAPTLEIPLDEQALEAKRRMLACHVTQRRTLAPFTAGVERFRAAPDYDLRKPPNGGRLYYETLPLNFDGRDWPRLVDHAIRELGLEEA